MPLAPFLVQSSIHPKDYVDVDFISSLDGGYRLPISNFSYYVVPGRFARGPVRMDKG
jgi:hypothetical protein